MANEQTPKEEHAEIMDTISALRGQRKDVPQELMERFAELDRQLNPSSQVTGAEGTPVEEREQDRSV